MLALEIGSVASIHRESKKRSSRKLTSFRCKGLSETHYGASIHGQRAGVLESQPSAKQNRSFYAPCYAVRATSTSLQPWNMSVVPLLERVHAVAQTSAGPSSNEYEFKDGIDEVFQS